MTESVRPDIVAKIKFLHTSEGGRKLPIPTERFNCIFVVDSDNFDCILLTGGREIYPGEELEVPIKFLFWNFVEDRVRPGTRFTLRELRQIATGEVLEVLADVVPPS